MAFQPNILGNFNSFSYHISLIMPDEPEGKSAGVNPTTSGIIIAETGKTANFYIESVKFETLAPNQVSGMKSAIVSGSIVLIEPLGFTFFDRYFAAKEITGWQSLNDSWLILKISFNGWNENGSPAPRYAPTYLKIKSVSINCDFDINGSRYTLDFTAASNMALEDEALSPKRSFKTELQETLEDTISEFETNFNKAIQHTQNADNAPPESGDIYKFSLGPFLSEKNLEIKLEPDADSTTSDRDTELKLTYEYDGEKIIPNALKDLCNSADGILDLMHPNVDENKRIDTEAAPGPRLARYYSVDLDISYGKFISSLNRYQRIYEYQIDLVPKPELEDMPPGTEGSRARADSYLREGVMAKRYDYYFTGQNTEVLDMKFDFNSLYYEAIQAFTTKSRDYTPSVTEETRESEQGLGDLRKGIGGSFPQSLSSAFGILAGIKRGERYLEDISSSLSMSDILNYRLVPNSDPNNRSGTNRVETPIEENEDATKESLESKAYTGKLIPLLTGELVIRGDPYWIDPAAIRGRNPTSANFNGGTKMLYFKMKIADPPEESNGMYPILGKNTISAIYQVMNVEHTFENGKFTQTLNLVIDDTTLGIEYK